MSFVIEKSEVRDYIVQGQNIRLRLDPLVFAPSAFGIQFGEQLDLRLGERVADIGTGTGIFAILAARLGAADVLATDTCRRALEVTDYNVTLNGVCQVQTSLGSFFSSAAGTFDAIIANLPQEIVPAEYLAKLHADQANGVNGRGVGGNAVLLDFLGVAPDFMHRSSRLYIIVNTVTDSRQTMNKVRSLYKPRLLWEGVAPTKDFVASAIVWYKELMRRGIVDVFMNEAGQWCARQYVYELRRR